jgi:hypothetical protein
MRFYRNPGAVSSVSRAASSAGRRFLLRRPALPLRMTMPRLTPDARQAANVDAYKAALSMFWGNMTALEQIVEEDFPDGANETIAPTRYQVDAIRDLGNRVGALVEGYSLPVPF